MSESYLAGLGCRFVVTELGKILLLHNPINIRFSKDISKVNNMIAGFT